MFNSAHPGWRKRMVWLPRSRTLIYLVFPRRIQHHFCVPEEPPQFSAFISYASADHVKAEEICSSLETRGLVCWIAPRDIRPGHEYGDEIIRGIQQSRCLVLVLSEAANESPFVRREVERAVSKRKPVFPIRIEEILPSPSLELFVSATHWIDAWSGRLVDHMDRLARHLRDDRVVEKATKLSEKIARRRQMPRWIMAAAGFAAVVIAIVVGNQVSHRLERGSATPSPNITFSAPPTPSFEEIQRTGQQHLQERLQRETEQTISGNGIQLKHIAAPKGQTAPTVYESFPSPTGKLQFVPLCSADIAAVKYSFDGDGYFDLTPVANYSGPQSPPFLIDEWEAGERLNLILKKADGTESGPFQYAVPEKNSLILKQLKADFLAHVSKAIQSALVPFTIPVGVVPLPSPFSSPTAAETSAGNSNKSFAEIYAEVDRQNTENSNRVLAKQQAKADAQSKEIDINVLLSSAGYPSLAKAPIVICVPERNTSMLRWAPVREVRLGTKSGALNRSFSVNIDWDQFLKVGTNYFSEPFATAKQWQALLPPDTKSIYAKFVFRDGSESDEIHYRVDTTSIHLASEH